MRLRQYIVAGPVASQMEKVFALLVESGAIYCALWVRPSSPYMNTSVLTTSRPSSSPGK